MSDDILAFNTVIAANPESATTHLVFADWLEERDQIARGQFHRSVGRFLEIYRHLPGRFAHWLPAGETFGDHVYADDDRFIVARNHSDPAGTTLLVSDLNDIYGGRGLKRRHVRLGSVAVVAVSKEFDRLPAGVEWDRLKGDIAGGAEFVGTFGDLWKGFSDRAALLRALSEAFVPEPAGIGG